MAAPNQGDLFDAYFKRADLDRDGRISGSEAVAFFQGSNLPKPVLAQIWTYADQNRTGYLGRTEFYNALKLVTVAQSKRELTPEIVKAALYGPASAKIPAPQINVVSSPVSQPNAVGTPPPSQLGAVAPTASQNPGFRGAPALPTVNMNQQYNQSPVNGLVRPPNALPGAAARPQGVGFQGGPSLGSNLPNSRGSSAGGEANAAAMSTTMFPSGTPGQVASLPSKPQMTSAVNSSATPALQPRPPVSQNGSASGSLFGGDAFSATQTRKDVPVPTSAGSTPVSSGLVPVSGGSQSSSKVGHLGTAPNSFTPQPVSGQLQKTQSLPKQNQQAPVPSLPPSGPRAVSPQGYAGHQPQLQWPRPSPTDLQKYTKVFMEVDTDKDGKITGEQARNLFLSWRLPREVLKQVWDLSDQDNDSMLSLREFCIALYLMERYREGRPLPAVLPSNVMLDFPAPVQQSGGYSNAAWGYAPGSQAQAIPGAGATARPPRPAGRPPLPIPAASADDRLPPKPQKAKVPVLEKHLVDQLSEEEQKSLNLKFQEASEANKKVEELEKEIKEAKEKMEFYRVKMQELVLYKSRCDSRFNEVSERASADKREVESLANKYEEKYRQRGDVASKLTIEEATFRDIQERKMEMYQAIVKMEQEGSGENLQDRADNIKSSLEELVKSLSERCKKYGLRAKPTTLLELPFGWQPGIQESAADWDADWDKFEDEGFAFVKELTLDVQNVIAPPRTKFKPAKKEKNIAGDGESTVPTSDAESKQVKPSTEVERVAENGVAGDHKDNDLSKSPVASPSARNAHESPRDGSKDNHFEKTGTADVSPKSKRSQSDFAVSGDKSFDEPSWGTFDTNADADSVWDSSKERDHDRHTDDLFGHGEWTLPPIKTGSGHEEWTLPPIKTGTSPAGLPKPSIFDSVPGTPADGFIPKKSIFADSVPGTPADGFFPKKSIFADSVPSTPLYGSSYSPQKSGEGPEERGFNFSRFDSFKSTDSGFHPQERFSRFDSMRYSGDFDSHDPRELSRFDSMRSTKDFDYDSRFSSFDDSDPFGSGPFKSSFAETPRRDSDAFGSAPFKSSFAETPRRDSDAFGSSETFRYSLGSETPRSEVDAFGSVGHFRSSFASETPTADSDPFGGPFRPSLGSETPRTDSDPFGAPFRSTMGSETPRSEVDPFGSVGPFSSSFGGETPRRESDYFAYSGTFNSSFGSETPRGEYDSFGYGGPLKSSVGSETPRRDSDAFGSSGPFKSSFSETPRGGTDGWSAF